MNIKEFHAKYGLKAYGTVSNSWDAFGPTGRRIYATLARAEATHTGAPYTGCLPPREMLRRRALRGKWSKTSRGVCRSAEEHPGDQRESKGGEECAQFSTNMAVNRNLVQAATRRAVEIQVASHTNISEVARDVWAVLYSYEEVLFIKHAKSLKVAYTRKAIENHGEIGAVERIVCQRSDDDDGFARLVAAGLPEMTFEAVVLRHPEHFSESAIEQAQAKLNSRG